MNKHETETLIVPKMVKAYQTIELIIIRYLVWFHISSQNCLSSGYNWIPNLSHFPIIKTDTKVRVIFDASASINRIYLKDAVNWGPKFHRELFDVLLHFACFPACDVSEPAKVVCGHFWIIFSNSLTCLVLSIIIRYKTVTFKFFPG